MKIWTEPELVAQLKQLGITPGGILLVHSSLRSLGKVEGGAETVVNALLEALGPEGTLLMPGFQSGSEYLFASSGICFDAKNTPSECGYLTEYFRNLPNVIRSLSPTHSISGLGPMAESLLADHEKCNVTAGWGSPFEKMIDAGSQILMLGTSRESNTTMHFLENTGGAPTVCAAAFDTSVISMNREKITTRIFPHMPGLHRNYTKAISLLEKAGHLRAGKVGDADCELYPASKLRDIVYKELALNPCAFIKVFSPEPMKY